MGEPSPSAAVLVVAGAPPASLDGETPLPLGRWDGAAGGCPTEVRIRIAGGRLEVSFHGVLRGLLADPSLPADRPIEGLWNLDVVELFVSPHSGGLPYFEIEISPLGQWLALAFDGPRRRAALPWRPALRTHARIGGDRFRCGFELDLCDLAGSGARDGHPLLPARIGAFRIHGREPAREHLALLACPLAAPDFHRPELWAPVVGRT